MSKQCHIALISLIWHIRMLIAIDSLSSLVPGKVRQVVRYPYVGGEVFFTEGIGGCDGMWRMLPLAGSVFGTSGCPRRHVEVPDEQEVGGGGVEDIAHCFHAFLSSMMRCNEIIGLFVKLGID